MVWRSGTGRFGLVRQGTVDRRNQTERLAAVADTPVVMASVFKIAVCLELYRQAATGEVDLAERHLVPAASRSPGPVGLSFMEHDVELSLGRPGLPDDGGQRQRRHRRHHRPPWPGPDQRHPAQPRVGAHGPGKRLRRHRPSDHEAVGASSPEELPPLEDPEVRRRLLACRALDLRTATRTSPRETTSLLAMTWRGEAGLPASRNGVAWLMAQQFCHARMAGAFPFPPWVGAKSGSLPPDVVNEAGVIDYLDGRRFAVAVFTRGQPAGQIPPASQPRGAIGRAIGEVARLAVEHLATKS
jgi:beta-lactamase class A